MCGILGIVGGPLPVKETTAESALDLLQHRGPDDRGIWQTDNAWLGHRRLSIIDTGPSGHQPMVHRETGTAIIFNGEIYNYIELRDELAAAGNVFRTHSDTEVLLVAYLEWGQQCVRRLNGMWSFLIWDPRTEEAFFSRDRFGVKPFYYTLARGRLSVASEPKSLMFLYPELRKVDDLSIYRFLTEGVLQDGSRSFYEGIHILQPAHCGTLRVGQPGPVLSRFWDFPPSDQPENSSADFPEQFRTLFEDAVRIRMRSDVPVGITISGGIDSTAVLHASQHNPDSLREKMSAYTSVYSPDSEGSRTDELEWARIATKPYDGVRLIEVRPETDWLPTLRRIAWHMDSPGYSPAVFPLWEIMKTARRQGVPVLLEGQGADELLGGYTQYASLAFLTELRNSLPRRGTIKLASLLRNVRDYQTTFGVEQFWLWTIRLMFPSLIAANRRLFGAQGALRKEFIKRMATLAPASIDSHPQPDVRQLLRDDFSRQILPALLHYGDAISMAHSIESRLPFLDYRLVEFGFRLPFVWKISDGKTKRILRKYLQGAGQTRVAARKDKVGYTTPIGEWLAASGAKVPRQILLDNDSHILEYCAKKEIKRLIEICAKGCPRTSNHVYRLLTTELWLRECIFQENKSGKAGLESPTFTKPADATQKDRQSVIN